MITYTPFFETIKKKNSSTYDLINHYNISSSTINRLRHNLPISTTTMNDLCTILSCSVEEIALFVPDEETEAEESKDKEY